MQNFWASEHPVADHLVDRVSDWPGASSLELNLSGRTKTVERPRGYFRPDGPMPDDVELRVEPVDGFEDGRPRWPTRRLLVRRSPQTARAECLREPLADG